MNSDAFLVVGATGFLGDKIVRRLQAAGRRVRALVRNDAAAAAFQAAGIETVHADLKEPETLARACAGVAQVVSTATATARRQAGDSIESVDGTGQLALVDAAERADVRHFVFISVPPASITEVSCVLDQKKLGVELRLGKSSLRHVILQPTNFMEVWLSPLLGFQPPAPCVLLGDGRARTNYVSVDDVAECAVTAALETWTGTLPLGGPDPVSGLEAISMCEESSGQKIEVSFDDEDAIGKRLRDAREAGDTLAEAYAALMLKVARGQVVAKAPLPHELKTVRDYLTRTFGSKSRS
jgi:uncharacterized protein YbjT (DUF2867 family)